VLGRAVHPQHTVAAAADQLLPPTCSYKERDVALNFILNLTKISLNSINEKY